MTSSLVELRTPAAVAQELGAFEGIYPVANWEWHGWKVWPYLRALLGRRVLDYESCTADTIGEARQTSTKLHGYRQVVSRCLEERRVNRRAGAAADQVADVLVVAGPTRRLRINSRWIHFVADPLVESLERQGLRCIVWQSGEPRQPAWRPARHISAGSHLGYLIRRRLAGCPVPASPPAWFPQFTALCERLAVPAPGWPELARSMRYITMCSDIMRRWIRNASVRLVILDCWTEWMQLAAMLAARKEGIDVLDIQHGLQEHGHPSYHYWHVAPEGGWEAWPNLFWVWGEKAYQLYTATNTIDAEVVIGGNPWLNAWRDSESGFLGEIGTARQHAPASGRTILVTMSRPASRQIEYVEAAASAAPSDWRWLLRLHPSTASSEREAIRRRLAGSCQRKLNLDEGTDRPLYALLAATDVHVSIESTACLEALAFGTPSVLISSRGAQMFRRYIEAGLMSFSPRPQDLPGAIELARQLPRAELVRAGEKIFAGPQCTEAACLELARRLHQRGGKPYQPTAKPAEAIGAVRAA